MDSTKEFRSRDVCADETGGVQFESLYLSKPLLDGLTKHNFLYPSPIQVRAIPLGKCGFDLIIKSKSGTGKTAVFGVITLEMIDVSEDHLQALILAPTREIAMQSCIVIKTIGENIKGLKVEYFIGGLPVNEDLQKAKGCHVAVGSPGRILHLLKKNVLCLEHVKLFVLDEADNLMEKNFQEDINMVYHRLPKNKQMLAVSATYPDDLDKFLMNYMRAPTHVTTQLETPILLGVKHFLSITNHNANIIHLMKIKNIELSRLLKEISFTQCLIFCNYQTRTENLCTYLNKNGWKAIYISAAQPQQERIKNLKQLTDCKCRIILSTDLTARGIDSTNVDLVINYDVPNDESIYLHRMGRAGRYGAKGVCVTIASKGGEVNKFCNIIGAIGGCNMSVPILPNSNLPSDIWSCDILEYESINGTLDETAKGAPKKINIPNFQEDIKECSAPQIESAECEMDEAQIPCEINTEDVRETNKQIQSNTVIEDLNCLDFLKKLAAGEDMSNKRVATSTMDICERNISLLNVSSLLLEETDENIDKNKCAKGIENFIQSLKQESQFLDVAKECMDQTDDNLSVDVDDLFIHAYDHIVCKSKPDWTDIYNFKDNKTKDKNVLESQPEPVNLLQDLLEYAANQDEPEYDNYWSEEDEDEYYEEYQEESTDIAKSPDLRWIPVESAANECIPQTEVAMQNGTLNQTDVATNYVNMYENSVDTFNSVFNQAETMQSFESAYEKWQFELTKIRDYIQQSVYVDEMIAFKHGKSHWL